jgi:hypothetical protein
MKKVLVAILLLVYFTVSTGFVVSLHYCMDRLACAQIGDNHSNKCPYCGMQKDGKCCRDDVKIVKLETTHLASNAISTNFSLHLIAVTTPEFFTAAFYNFSTPNRAIAHSPPLGRQDTYIQNCVFRI